MVKKAHFIDIDAILDIGNKAWVVDRNKPNIPIMKISKSDFNLLQNGIYRKQGNKVEFNGKTFWLPNDLANELKVKSKNHRVPFSDFAISLQEFMNKDLIDNIEFDLNLGALVSLKNTTDDIYIICSKQTKISHDLIIQKIESSLKEEGLQVKNFYFISETFYNQKDDEIEHKKIRLLLQHAIGYRTDGDKFTDKEITRYDIIEYYDNNLDTMILSKGLNPFLNMIWKKTDDGLRSVIKEDITLYNPQIVVNRIFDNKVNRTESVKIKLSISNIFKTFESFKLFEGFEEDDSSLKYREKYYRNKSNLEDYFVELEDRGDEVKVHAEYLAKIPMSDLGTNRYEVTISSVKSDIEDIINWNRLYSEFNVVSKRMNKLKLRGRSNILRIILTDKN